MLYGPNTNGGGSIIAQDERAAEVMVRVAKRMVRKGYSIVETEKSAESRFTEWVDQRNRVNWGATYAGCHNYYMSRSGRNVTQYPEGQVDYWIPYPLYGSDRPSVRAVSGERFVGTRSEVLAVRREACHLRGYEG